MKNNNTFMHNTLKKLIYTNLVLGIVSCGQKLKPEYTTNVSGVISGTLWVDDNDFNLGKDKPISIRVLRSKADITSGGATFDKVIKTGDNGNININFKDDLCPFLSANSGAQIVELTAAVDGGNNKLYSLLPFNELLKACSGSPLYIKFNINPITHAVATLVYNNNSDLTLASLSNALMNVGTYLNQLGFPGIGSGSGYLSYIQGTGGVDTAMTVTGIDPTTNLPATSAVVGPNATVREVYKVFSEITKENKPFLIAAIALDGLKNGLNGKDFNSTSPSNMNPAGSAYSSGFEKHFTIVNLNTDLEGGLTNGRYENTIQISSDCKNIGNLFTGNLPSDAKIKISISSSIPFEKPDSGTDPWDNGGTLKAGISHTQDCNQKTIKPQPKVPTQSNPTTFTDFSPVVNGDNNLWVQYTGKAEKFSLNISFWSETDPTQATTTANNGIQIVERNDDSYKAKKILFRPQSTLNIKFIK